MKKILYSKPIFPIFKFLNRMILSIFYKRKYLSGYYFDEKLVGWLWAWKGLFFKIVGRHRGSHFPIGFFTYVRKSENVIVESSSLNVFQSPGCYFQNFDAKIHIGSNVFIAPNVGIITANHDLYDLKKHLPGKDIIIGDDCWIGMNSVVLPGVVLGNHTIVAAGSVVNKSFLQGNCVIGGSPAKIIRALDS